MTASISTHAGLDHRTSDSDPTAPWPAAPQAYSELTPADDHPVESPFAAAPRYYGNGPVIAALLGAGLACAALGLVIVDNISASPRTVAVAPGAATGPAMPVNAPAPGVGADFVSPAGVPAPPAAPAAAPILDPAPVVASGPAAVGTDSPPPPPPPPPAPADGPAPADPPAADPGSPPPPPSGPVVVVNVPMLPVAPPVHILPPPPPPIVKPLPAPVIPLPIVKLPPPPAPGPAVCLPPHHLVSGHCQ